MELTNSTSQSHHSILAMAAASLQAADAKKPAVSEQAGPIPRRRFRRAVLGLADGVVASLRRGRLGLVGRKGRRGRWRGWTLGGVHWGGGPGLLAFRSYYGGNVYMIPPSPILGKVFRCS